MPKDFLAGAKDYYDVVVIGSGLAGMTAANTLARAGRSVLLCEQHYKLGGMATWFKRPGGHIFDISLHGFPIGMIKSCKRYWTKEIADSIVQLKNIRFDNPMFSLTTTFNREDFTRLLIEQFQVPTETVHAFFDAARQMNFYDDQQTTTRELFDRFFPGREDVIRLLMEPITYANGSTLEDPAISYGIVFSNFMSKGVFTFEGGTDRLIHLMEEDMKKSGVDIRIRCDVEKILVENGRANGVVINGRTIKAGSVISNSNLRGTILELVGEDKFDAKFVEETKAVRLNNSSTQVYMALKPDDTIPEETGDLLFSSTAPAFRTDLLLSRDITSRTYSFYYPRTRPEGRPRCLIVSSTNARYEDWANLPEDEYEASKQDLVETTLDAIEKYVPNIRERIDHAEASTPRTFQHYTKHNLGSSFGTKFEGLAVSRALPDQLPGLYHAGSVGIIMSGWLGAINYGVIVSNDVDAYLLKTAEKNPFATTTK
ncbi:NAD(P)/FAD-dependent oxidoreductase [Blastopirellula sp. JC732]|uniref:NAD(P)/FAD-dependent oxidoreductase n=1 Tax=Blastopirellula sediminis TaxID=2894196 RepID=A0A9X1MLG6_9BACT|nr:NAD(P)/FAD-dependent oxidoreductase [Blastopirellula sediminis]MCC9608813.1 NAD(P)/FAD-dependent oxidoreductase [Blastopirellula sediminis]MCC9628410.1 NAD(P)/FAD-dependent oxidoreductase [Blastopirellula sediminis]